MTVMNTKQRSLRSVPAVQRSVRQPTHRSLLSRVARPLLGAVAGLALAASVATSAHAVVIADSQADFPAADNVTSDSKQGIMGWTYGYHNATGNGTYQASDFIAFEDNGGPGTSATDFWNGNAWDWHSGNPPWTTIGSTSVHPNGANHGGPSPDSDEQWAIRRYTVEAAEVVGKTDLELTWYTEAANLNGTGVTGVVFHNGTAVDIVTIPGNGASGNRTVIVQGTMAGDTIDLALLPVGLNGDRSDGSDGSRNGLIVDNIGAAPAVQFGDVIANSVAEFSGVQGLHGWEYGYYSRTADLDGAGDGVYQTGEFTQFLGGILTPEAWGDTNHWDGAWDYNPPGAGNGNPEWTTISATSMHPNDAVPGDEHYVIRRWVSDYEGNVQLAGFFQNVSSNGDGTFGRILLNGVELDAFLTDGFRSDFLLKLHLSAGDILDFLVDTGPNPAATGADGNDGTNFAVTITAIPEPASAALGLLSLAGLAMRRRRD